MRGKRLTSLKEIVDAAENKRSLTGPFVFGICKPAAFVIHQPGVVLQGMLDSGLYLYEKADKDKEVRYGKDAR